MPLRWRDVPLDTWTWAVFKVILGFGWTHAMLFVTPESLRSALSEGAVAWWTVGTMLGAIVSLAGMVLTMAAAPCRARLGLAIEIVGIVLLAGGPLQYLGIQVGILTTDFENRYALAWFALAMVWVIMIRLAAVLAQFVRASRAHDFQEALPSKEAGHDAR